MINSLTILNSLSALHIIVNMQTFKFIFCLFVCLIKQANETNTSYIRIGDLLWLTVIKEQLVLV
jgi:hypothetical protein